MNVKKLIAKVLTASMVLSIAPVPALASAVDMVAAVAAAEQNKGIDWNNKVYTLTQDTTIGGTYEIKGDTYTINLDTYTLTADTLVVAENAVLTVKNKNTDNQSKYGTLNTNVQVKDSSTLTINADVNLAAIIILQTTQQAMLQFKQIIFTK